MLPRALPRTLAFFALKTPGSPEGAWETRKASQLRRAAQEQFSGFDAAAFRGKHEGRDADVVLLPDLQVFRVEGS